MLILEIGWRVNFRFHLVTPPSLGACASEGSMKTGIHTASDSKDNFHKLLGITEPTFSLPPLIKIPYKLTCKCHPFPKRD